MERRPDTPSLEEGGRAEELQSELEKRTKELKAAKGKAAKARRELKARSQRRISELEAETERARLELEQEREQALRAGKEAAAWIGRLEGELRAAREHAGREHELRSQLEQRVQAVTNAESDVRNANERLDSFLAEVERESAARTPSESNETREHAAAERRANKPSTEGESLERPVEPALADERRETPQAEVDSEGDQDPEAASAPAQVAEPAHEPRKPKRKLLSRFKGSAGKGAFITSEARCAVCQRAFMAGSEEALELSGWRVNGDVGLCPACQSGSWQLPEGARLPFRNVGQREQPDPDPLE